MINWAEISDNEEVIELIQKLMKLEEQIRDIDELALLRFNLATLDENPLVKEEDKIQQKYRL